jgi:hypothetical protein
MIENEIRILLDAPAHGTGAPPLSRLEDTLTAGYAHALALESQCLQLERRRRELLGAGTIDDLTQELAVLTVRITEADQRLGELRTLLDSLRRRANEIRAA